MIVTLIIMLIMSILANIVNCIDKIRSDRTIRNITVESSNGEVHGTIRITGRCSVELLGNIKFKEE